MMVKQTFKATAVFKHNGKKEVIKIVAPAAETMKNFRSAYHDLINKEKALRAAPADEDAQEKYGNAVLAAFGVVIGGENLMKLLLLYGRDAGEFVRDVKTYVVKKALPKLKKMEAKEYRG